MGNERFILVGDKNNTNLNIGSNQVHPVENGKSFVPECILDFKPAKEISRFIAVSFPESQLFMDDYQDEIFLINDEHGLKKYGHAAYFIKESLYKKVMVSFGREQFSHPEICDNGGGMEKETDFLTIQDIFHLS